MIVSSRHILTGTIAAMALAVAGGVAVAGGEGPRDKPRTQVPSNGQRAKAPRPSFQPRINIPPVNVRGSKIIVNQGNVSINQSVVNLGAVGASSFFGGNGGFATPATPVSPSTLNGLAVVGADQIITETITEQVPVTEESCLPQMQMMTTTMIRPVQAVCIDDKGTPHPASRLNADKSVARTYDGEVFRCLAGTHMQVTLGQIEHGEASFAQGETFSCAKGEALVHGNGGQLTCAPAKPQRNCNERSLLRRHGAGIKLIHSVVQQPSCVPTQRTTYKTVTKEVHRTVPNENGPIVLDGGVGQGVF